MSDINGASHVHEFPVDVNVEGVSPGNFVERRSNIDSNRLAELQGAQVLFDTAPEVAKFMSNLQRANEMAATREQRVNEAVDAAWPVPDNAAE